MDFLCQSTAIADLTKLADQRRHSVLISGVKGSGKTYLAKQYASLLNVYDFQEVKPKVDDIRTAIDNCIALQNEVVLCIENLDMGVNGAAYSLLKFLEEPNRNVYIVVTVRNIQRVPDTIISRSASVVTAAPRPADIEAYATAKDFPKFHSLENLLLWKCVRSFDEVDLVFNFNPDKLAYFDDLKNKIQFNDTIANMSWQLGHYPDNTETPLELVIRYLMELVNTPHIRKCGISCIRELNNNRLASHAVLSKFLFEMKYTY